MKTDRSPPRSRRFRVAASRAPSPPSPPRRSRRRPSPRPRPRRPAIRVYYFHGTTRCATCRTIEAYAHETRRDRLRPGPEGAEPRVAGGQRRRAGEPALHRATSSSTRARWSSWTRRTRSASRCSTGCGSSCGDKAAFQKYVEQEIRALPAVVMDATLAVSATRPLAGAADLGQPLPARREHRGHVLRRPGGRAAAGARSSAGLLYTLGRALAYAALAAILVGGLLSIPQVALFLQAHMNRVLGPLLVAVGLVLLEWVRLPGLRKPGSTTGPGSGS